MKALFNGIYYDTNVSEEIAVVETKSGTDTLYASSSGKRFFLHCKDANGEETIEPIDDLESVSDWIEEFEADGVEDLSEEWYHLFPSA